MSKCSATLASVAAPPPRARQGFGGPCYPRQPSQVAVLHPPPAVLKILRVVKLLHVVNLLSHRDLLSRRALCGHHFFWSSGKSQLEDDRKLRFRFRGCHGGVEKEGEGKPHECHPSQIKKGFWTPPRTVRFPLPSSVSALFFLYKNPRQSRTEALLEGSKRASGERVLWCAFLPPYVLHPPNIAAQEIIQYRTLRLLNELNIVRIGV